MTRRKWLIPLLVAFIAVGATGAAMGQSASSDDDLDLDLTLTPEKISRQAGTMAGMARVCKVDSARYMDRVSALLKHLADDGASLQDLTDGFKVAADQSEAQERSEPTVGCTDFSRLFGELWINQSDWTPEMGWKPL